MPYLTDEEINERIARESNRANGLARIGQAEEQEWASWLPKPEIEKVKPERTLGGTLQNLGVGLGKGVMQAGAGIVGLANIPTGGYAGKGLEAVGVDFGDWAEDIGEYYTPAQKAAMERRSQKLSEADTFGGKLKAIASEPATIVQDVVESLPMMVGGAGIARGILGASKGYQALSTADKIRRGITAGAIGEGAMAAGSAAEDIRSQTDDGTLSLGQTGAAIGTGIGTSALGIIGGRIANELGIGDVDTLFATGQLAEKSNKGVIRRILEGGISEGVFEELPQSAQEQIWLNAALGKDLTEGVEEAGAAGLLAGAAMGGAGNVVTRGGSVETDGTGTDQNLSQEEQDLATIQTQIKETITRYNQDKPEETINKLNELYQQEKDLKDKMAGERYEVPLPEDIDEINRQIANLEAVENPNRGTVELLEQLRQHKENLPGVIAQRRMHEQRADQQGLYENLMSPEQDILTRPSEDIKDATEVLENAPRKLRPNDMLTRAGKPYARRDYLKNFLAEQDNSNDYEIVEVNLKDAYQAEKNRLQQELNAGRYLGREAVLNELNDLENKIENISAPDQTGYVARLTDEALDKQRPEVIAEREALLSDYQQLGEDTDAFNVKIDSIKKQQRIKEIDRELASEDVKKDPEKRRELNRELASIFTDIDRVMSGRFQRDFEIGRTERADQMVEEAPAEENLVTQPGVTPVGTQAEPTGEKVGRATEESTETTQVNLTEQLKADIATYTSDLDKLNTDLNRINDELNEIEVDKPFDYDTYKKDLLQEKQDLIDNIADTDEARLNAKTELVREILTNPDTNAQLLTSEEVADFRKANNLPEIKMRKDGSHPTQIATTKATYRKVYNLMPDEVKSGRILDYGAGKNIAGKELGQEANIESFEPFPEKGFNPTYKDSSKIPSNSFVGVFNNAVLNVVPDDIRNSIVREIGRVLAPGGKAYINTRGKDVFDANHHVIDKDNMEVIIAGNRAYQKGFKKDELVNYLQETLGDNFSVTPGKFGAVGAIVTKKEASPQLQTGGQATAQPLTFDEIKGMYKGQDVAQADDGTISVRFKNGKGAKIQSIQDAGDGFIQMAIETGQMSKNGKILGVTVGNNILFDSEFADKKTAWHENEHLLENMEMIRKGDISALNKEFNKLRKTNKLDFAISTHEDPKQAMAENRANMFAQVMVNREVYKDTPLGDMIQRVMDFFNSLYLHGRRFVTGSDYQNVRGLAREVESGRIYGRETGDQTTQNNDANWDKKYPKINFEVREQLNIPEQIIPESEYAENRKQHRDMVARTKQALKSTGRSLNRTLNKYLGVTSTNLLKIHPMLQAKAKRLDFDTIKRIQANLKVATPVLEKMGKMSKNDRADFSWAVKNGDFGKIVSLTRSYNFTEEYQALQNMLDKIHQDLKDVGYRPGYVENYWPRAIKDYEGFLLATQEISQEPIFTKALEQQAKKLGKEVSELSPDMRANIISQKIEDVKLGVGGPGNIHQRVYDKIPIDLGKYYAGASASLVNYIYSTSKNIEGRRFFGKVPPKIKNAREIIFNKTNEIEALKKQKAALIEAGQDTTEIDNQIIAKQDYIDDHQKKLEEYGQVGEFKEDIGAYIDELMTKGLLKPENEKTLKDILEARFYEHGVTGTANVFKNISLIDTMGSPLSAITQIQELGFSVYVGGLTPRGITNSVRNIGKAIAKRSDIKKEDMGLEWISQEFADPDTLSRALNRVFKLTGLDRMDTIGKESLINNAYDNYRVKAENKDKLFEEIRHMFSSDKETNEVINDLKNDKKDSNNVQFLVFSRLLDFQPATKSEMAEKALTLGNWRLAYLLKSFTIKQIDVFRRDVWHKLKEGHKNNDKAMILEGMRNMGMLLGLLSLAGAGADELKDLVLGKDIKFEDHLIEQLASLGGANRYLRMQVRKEGVGTALGKQILPPFKFIDAITKDTAQNTWDLDTGRWVDSIPLAGKIYYWRMGRAAQYRSSSEEKEMNKDKKKFKKFETGLEEATDKRLYIRSNYDTFKQKKLYEKFDKALKGNKKTIDKLKDIDQTPNVKKRLNQLENQRKVLLNRYFEMKDNL